MEQENTRAHEHRPRLGRGLAALLGETSLEDQASEKSRGVRKAPIEFLRANPKNPRKIFSENDLDELTDSVRERGVLQPILVRAVARVSDAYEIVAGERRWRAAQRAGLHDVPIIVLEVSDREALEIAIIENVQRSDLNALEEASGYIQLAAEHGYSHADIAKVVGKSRSHIANTTRLLNLPDHARDLLSSGAISAGHARALLAVDNPNSVADRIVEQGLTVRDVERLGENSGKTTRARTKTTGRVDADTKALEDKLALTLGARVKILHSGDNGELRVTFSNFDQLDDFCRRLTAHSG